MRWLACILLALVTSSFAATLAERSPFAQGLWWDRTKSGHGFQIFNSADQAMVVWYTYDDSGRPTWYTAQGELTSVGTVWPLLKHSWTNGHKADPTQVGTLRLTVRHPEGADLSWTIGSTSGTWSIQPFTVSGVVNEIDHTGLWYDPANSGWGFSLLEQGDVLGGILYGYDALGSPTWAAGFDRTPGRVQLWSYTGPCPSCLYAAPTTRAAGQLTFDFRSELQLVLGSNLGIPMAAGTNLDGATITQLTRPASWRPADRQLATFASDASLKTYLGDALLRLPSSLAPPTTISASPPTAPAGPTFSSTNLVESGVDESDLVKTNGRYVYAYAHDSGGTRLPMVRVVQVVGDGASFAAKGSVALASGPDTPMANAGLFLDGDNLVSVSAATAYSPVLGPAPWYYPNAWGGGKTMVEVLNVSTPDAPVTRWRASIDGYLISTRRVGQRVYVVTRFVPSPPGFVYGSGASSILNGLSLADLLPKVSINGGAASPVVGASEVYAPPQGTRPVVADMIVVAAIDLAAPRIAQSLAILGGVEGVYTSPLNMYVATSRYTVRTLAGALVSDQQGYPVVTDIHQVALGASAMTVTASGSVEGLLGSGDELPSFRMSEYQNRLRVVSSANTGMWRGATSNRLSILEASTITPGLLKTVSYLPNAGRPETLGKTNEFLHSTRFAGDRLYAVTFKKIDPLYVVDIADAADPKIAGELVLPGFSDYLHPLANGLLLGFGKDTKPSDTSADGGTFAWYQGLQLTLFDVSNAGMPREIQRMIFGKRGSDSPLLSSHHAFSMLQNADGSASIAFPASINDGVPSFNSGDSTIYPWQQSGLMRVELRGSTPSNAQLVQSIPNLITNAVGTTTTQRDPTMTGRSILFPNGALYTGLGMFWSEDKQGAHVGPF